jgi:hypothetical protein
VSKMAKELELSEFIANQDILLFYKKTKDGFEQCSNILSNGKLNKEAIRLNLAKFDKIPKLFIPSFLEHNRGFIGHWREINGEKIFDMKFPEKKGLPYITPEQEKEYGVSFKRKPPELPIKTRYSTEKLMEKWKELGEDKFKNWAEKTFNDLLGKDIVDKRKKPRTIINNIRKVLG